MDFLPHIIGEDKDGPQQLQAQLDPGAQVSMCSGSPSLLVTAQLPFPNESPSPSYTPAITGEPTLASQKAPRGHITRPVAGPMCPSLPGWSKCSHPL